MSRTICFYQHPEALHEIDAWRQQMGSRILSWDRWAPSCDAEPASIHRVQRLDGQIEAMFIVPLLEASSSHWSGLASEDWDKTLYFGKIMGPEAVALIAASMRLNLSDLVPSVDHSTSKRE